MYTIIEIYVHLDFCHDLIRKEWLKPKRAFTGLCAMFIREMGLSSLQGEGLRGLRKEENPEPGPGE